MVPANALDVKEKVLATSDVCDSAKASSNRTSREEMDSVANTENGAWQCLG